MAGRILLVEDNEDDVALTLRALEKNRLHNDVEIVRDGQEALDLLFRRGEYASRPAAELPELILLDLKVPRVDGLEVLRQIRASPITQFLPVVVLTSSSQERDMVQSYQLGANSYVQKPVDFDDFIEATRQLGMYWLVLNKLPPS